MQKSKCHQCGLVNWHGATVCARCNASLTESYSTGLNPFENETKSGRGLRVAALAVAAVILSLVGVGAYQVLQSESLKSPAMSNGREYREVMREEQLKQMENNPRIKEVYRDTALPASDESKASSYQQMSPDQLKKSRERYCSEGRSFGPGRTPAGCTDDGLVKMPNN